MKRNILIVAAFIGSLFLASCGENKDAKFMKQADDMFAQAEQDLQGIDDIDDFFTFYGELQEKKDGILMEMMEAYVQTDSTVEAVPEEVRLHIYNRATEYNKVEAVKYAELFDPFLANLENALEANDKEAAKNALDAMMPYAMYDNVVPELQERAQVAVVKAEAMGLL